MKLVWKLAVAAVGLIVCATVARLAYNAHKPRIGTRALFIGNSFTFVNNLPAVFAALGKANGFPVATEMLVESGATLADRTNDGSARRLLMSGRFDYVILQERAGSVLCGLQQNNGVDECEQSRSAHKALANIARENSTKTIVLGTYTSPQLAPSLQSNEKFLAEEIGATYVPVAAHLLRGLKESPDLDWYAADGGHPGADLTLLDAVLLYRAIFSSLPEIKPIVVHGPIFDVSTAIFTLDWRSVRPAAVEHVYDVSRIAPIVALVAASP